MFSKKNMEGGYKFEYMIPEGDPIPQGRWIPKDNLTGEHIAGRMERGVPFMLIEDPKYVSFKIKVLAKVKGKTKRVWKTASEKRWKLRILHLGDQKVYHMYLTKRGHDALLVKAVQRRFEKDYSSEATTDV